MKVTLVGEEEEKPKAAAVRLIGQGHGTVQRWRRGQAVGAIKGHTATHHCEERIHAAELTIRRRDSNEEAIAKGCNKQERARAETNVCSRTSFY